EGLVTGDHRQPTGAHRPLVLLNVAAADAARLDPQQRPVLGAGDDGPGELAQLHLPWPGLDHGADHVSHRQYSRVLIGLGPATALGPGDAGVAITTSPCSRLTIYDTW